MSARLLFTLLVLLLQVLAVRPEATKCYEGDASGPDFASVVTFPEAALQSPFTIVVRIRSSYNATQEIIGWGKGTNDEGGVEFRVDGSGSLEYGEHDGSDWRSVQASPKGNLLDSNFHVVAVTRQLDGAVSLFADGAQIGAGSVQSALPSGLVAEAKSARLHAQSNDHIFNGHVGPLHIHASALSLTEITELRAATQSCETVGRCYVKIQNDTTGQCGTVPKNVWFDDSDYGGSLGDSATYPQCSSRGWATYCGTTAEYKIEAEFYLIASASSCYNAEDQHPWYKAFSESASDAQTCYSKCSSWGAANGKICTGFDTRSGCLGYYDAAVTQGKMDDLSGDCYAVSNLAKVSPDKENGQQGFYIVNTVKDGDNTVTMVVMACAAGGILLILVGIITYLWRRLRKVEVAMQRNQGVQGSAVQTIGVVEGIPVRPEESNGKSNSERNTSLETNPELV